jgi:DNA-binding transcriptional LysR family regulator
MDLTDLNTFVHVVEAGSFTKAGESLGLPVSTISRRVSRLEESLQLTLFHRNGRFFKLTRVGELVFKRCQAPLRELSEVQKSLLDEDEVPRGQITLSMSTEMGGSLALAELFREFRQACPEVQLSIEVSNRFVDLIEESVDVAIRIHSDPLPDRTALMMKRLQTMTVSLYATPNYLKQHGEPMTLDALEQYDCVSFSHRHLPSEWTLEKGEEKRTVEIQPVMLCNEFTLMRLAVLAETGLGPLPDFLVQKDLQEGRLVKLLADWTMLSGHVSLVWPTTRHMAPRVRAFLDFMTLHFAERMGSSRSNIARQHL